MECHFHSLWIFFHIEIDREVYPTLGQKIEITLSIPLKSGWNLASFPLIDYTISSMNNIYPYVYVYYPDTSSYEQVDINRVSGKGFWV